MRSNTLQKLFLSGALLCIAAGCVQGDGETGGSDTEAMTLAVEPRNDPKGLGENVEQNSQQFKILGETDAGEESAIETALAAQTLEDDLEIEVSQATFLKETTAQSDTLRPDQKCAVAAGTRIKLYKPAEPAFARHFWVELQNQLPDCNRLAGFVYTGHVVGHKNLGTGQKPADDSKQNSPANPSQDDTGSKSTPATHPKNGKLLEVPYFYQYANKHRPWGTCNITSVAMLLKYYGIDTTPDRIFVRQGGAVYTGPAMARIGKQHGLKAAHYPGVSANFIKKQIDMGRPVILQGWFTPGSGHIFVIVGYDETGWYVNDPSGKWALKQTRAYWGKTPTNGKSVHYPYRSVLQYGARGRPNNYLVTVFHRP